ncbi:conserved hypothetical protein [Sulfolobus islandicus Y.G.57.14]|uniref:Glycosylated S-layer protein, SlaA n=1 Tax=Saccharolobus islandicus (strain Y.G.57.14 / Yellowstone \|nr:hypothetical protein [Sulfolobus islandicus]ACP46088.1 conserved hypothetical protein [Sulfolobus islandicus Y.G.57.14]
MNKTLGLILTSVFLLSTLGIIPGLVLTTEAITTNPAAAIFTSPRIITLSNTSATYINLFLNPFDYSLSQKAVEGYDFGLAINYTVNVTSLTISIPSGSASGTYTLPLSSVYKTIVKYAYYEQANESVFIVLYTGNSSTNAFGGEQQVALFEIGANMPISNVSNYLNKTLSTSSFINVLNINFLLSQATGGKITAFSQLPAGSQIQISYEGFIYTITVVHTEVLPGTLVNPLQTAGVIPNPGYVQAVGRSNITVGVYDPSLATKYATTPFNFTLTYSSQTPAVVNWFVIFNTTTSSNVKSNFYAPVFALYNTGNNTIYYSSKSSGSPFLQFNGQLNVTAYENVTGTLQGGTNIYVSTNLNVTPPGNYFFSGKLGVLFNGFIYTNGSATLTANIFNGSIFFFLPTTGTAESFTFFIAPVVPANLTTNIMSPSSVLVIYNGIGKFYVAFPELVEEYDITATYIFFSGQYIISGSVYEAELNPTFINGDLTYGMSGITYTSNFSTLLLNAAQSPVVSFTNFGLSTTTLTGTSLTFTVLMPLKFTVSSLGYVFLVIFHIWGPSTTVTVTGVDRIGDTISAGTFRSYIALPTYNVMPPTSINYLTCDNHYTQVQVLDPGSVLYTIQNNVMQNNATVSGKWDLMGSMAPSAVPSYLAAGLHVAIYNGTKLIKSSTFGLLPNDTVTPVTFTISLQGQTVPLTYSTIPNAVYPVDFKFEPSTVPSYSVTANVTTNTSVPIEVVTLYIPLQSLLNTKIVLWYVSPDFAAYFYYSTTGQFHTPNVTISFAPVTPELVMPPIFPVSKLYMPFGISDPYYEFFNSISLGPLNGIIELTENGINVGNITSITVQINGMNESIVLSPTNVTKLLVTPNLGEVSQCSPLFEGTIFNISALASLLKLPNVGALNGSYLYITYHDAITGAYVTNKTLLTVGAFYVMPPTVPGSVEWILTAKYVNATTGIPVDISYGVVQQPSATIVDLNTANISTTSIVYIPVVSVQIVSKYATVQVMYNPTNASTIVYMNGMFVTSYKGNLLPSLPETAPLSGKFFGPVINLFVTTGSLSSPNGTMYVVLGPNKVAVGTANLYTYAGYHFGPYTALPLASNVTFTVQDPVTKATVSGQTTLGAFNNTPIRLAPLGVSIPQTAQYKVFYYYNTPLVLSPTSQYIVLSATSVIPYPYPFYIETVSFLGYNVTTGTPVPGTPAFQTVYSPSLGPGVVLQVPVQSYQFISLSSPSEPHTVVMFAVPFAGGPAISLYPTFLVYTNVTAVSS